MIIPELAVFFTAMTPFFDLKLSIPLGKELGLSVPITLLFSIAGNVIPAALTLAAIKPLTEYARNHSPKMDRIITKIFKKTRESHSKYKDKFRKYGVIFLAVFIALPLPGSGTIGGSLIAFIIGLDYWKALAGITAGIILAAVFISAGVESIAATWNYLF